MDITTVLVFFCLASAVITYGLGLCVYAKNPGSAVNRLFLLAMLAASYWAAGEFMIWQSAGYDAVRFWLKASSFWTLAIVLHLPLRPRLYPAPACGKTKPEVPAGLPLRCPRFSSLSLKFSRNRCSRSSRNPGSGMSMPLPWTARSTMVESVMFVLIMVFALYIGFSSWLKQKPGRARKRNFLVSIGIVIIVLSGAMSAFTLPLCGIHIPNTVFFGIVCFSGIISYAMIWQGLFTLTPESAAANIIRMMPEGLILADNTGRIITVNASAEALFHKKRTNWSACRPRPSSPGRVLKRYWAAIREKGMLSDLEAVLETPEYRVVSIAGSLIKDPDGDLAGFVLIIHDITGPEDLGTCPPACKGETVAPLPA